MSPTRFPTRRGLLLATAGALGGCALPSPDPAPPAPGFDAWADALAADWVRLSPERATSVQMLSPAEQRQLDRQLTPRGDALRGRTTALARRGLEGLALQMRAPLTPMQRTSAETLRWSLTQTLAAQPYSGHRFEFNQSGLHVGLINFLSGIHPLREPEDVDTFLARLAQVAPRIDEGIAAARRAAGRDLLPPRFIVERARAQLEAFLRPNAEDNLFVQALRRRSADIAGLAPARRTQALAQAVALVEQQVRPAYRRVHDLLEELHPRTTADAGLWRFRDGEAAYAQALAFNTTTALDAGQIHAIGLAEVARIEGEMDRLLKGLGHSSGSVRARMAELNRSLQPPAEPDPRPQLLARYAAAVQDAQRRSQPLFRVQPRAPVEVRREPALTERTAAAHYTTPAPDGSRPGVFWVPMPGPSFNMLGMRSLAVHEAVPGHHFQLAVQQETTELPLWRQRRIFGGGSAHSEGWALYAERLAIEQGWYEGDPHGLLGAWDGQLFRARRLVVDTGLHARRWTREQAIEYGISAQEVERYVSNPGQACAYMIGMRRIVDLRERARQAMGPRFELVAFHDLVLRTGSVPLAVLDDVVRAWQDAPRG